MHITSPAELALCKLALEGDQAAIAKLICKYRRPMRAAIHKVLHRTCDAFVIDEVLAAAQVKMWRGIGTFKGDSAFGTWCHRIAVNCALTALRDRKRRPSEPGAQDSGQDRFGQDDVSAEDKADQRQQIKLVQAALETVEDCDPLAHAVFCKHRIDGIPLVHLAVEHGITRVKARELVAFVDRHLRENIAA